MLKLVLAAAAATRNAAARAVLVLRLLLLLVLVLLMLPLVLLLVLNEDLASAGTSAHKAHLLARKRWAEAHADAESGLADMNTIEEGAFGRASSGGGGVAESTVLAKLPHAWSAKSPAQVDVIDLRAELQSLQHELTARPPLAGADRRLERWRLRNSFTFSFSVHIFSLD